MAAVFEEEGRREMGACLLERERERESLCIATSCSNGRTLGKEGA